MQVGSLVECIRDDFSLKGHTGIKHPVRGNIYTIRSIHPGVDEGHKNKLFVLLDEVRNAPAPNGVEYNFDMRAFVELQPPMDLELVRDLQWYNHVKDLL